MGVVGWRERMVGGAQGSMVGLLVPLRSVRGGVWLSVCSAQLMCACQCQRNREHPEPAVVGQLAYPNPSGEQRWMHLPPANACVPSKSAAQVACIDLPTTAQHAACSTCPSTAVRVCALLRLTWHVWEAAEAAAAMRSSRSGTAVLGPSFHGWAGSEEAASAAACMWEQCGSSWWEVGQHKGLPCLQVGSRVHQFWRNGSVNSCGAASGGTAEHMAPPRGSQRFVHIISVSGTRVGEPREQPG